MKRLSLIFAAIMMAIESTVTKKQGVLWEFVEDVNDQYGRFKNVKTGEISILSKEGEEFQRERYYEFKPARILTGFGLLGTPTIENVTWRRVAYP